MMATTTQVQAALTDVASLLDQADAMLTMGNIDDDVRDALDELRAELARVDAAQPSVDTDFAPLVGKADRVRDLLDQISLDRA
jgi:hypothetical protein